MKTLAQKRFPKSAATVAAVLWLAGWSSLLHADNISVNLMGKEEVPPVATAASGSGNISINQDKTVSGSIKTKGVAGTMAHIHSGRPGQNGPVVIPLNKTAADVWSVPAGASLPDAAYNDFAAGNLYVNVHSEAHPGGEIRGQIIVPPKMKDQPNAVQGGGGGGY